MAASRTRRRRECSERGSFRIGHRPAARRGQILHARDSVLVAETALAASEELPSLARPVLHSLRITFTRLGLPGRLVTWNRMSPCPEWRVASARRATRHPGYALRRGTARSGPVACCAGPRSHHSFLADRTTTKSTCGPGCLGAALRRREVSHPSRSRSASFESSPGCGGFLPLALALHHRVGQASRGITQRCRPTSGASAM